MGPGRLHCRERRPLVERSGARVAQACHRALLLRTLAQDVEPGRSPEQAVIACRQEADGAAPHVPVPFDGLHPDTGHAGQDLAAVPSARTPPQGPFSTFFGQFRGQDMPVDESTQAPHMRQSKRGSLDRSLDGGDRPFEAFVANEAREWLDGDDQVFEDDIETGKAVRVANRPVSHGAHGGTPPAEPPDQPRIR